MRLGIKNLSKVVVDNVVSDKDLADVIEQEMEDTKDLKTASGNEAPIRRQVA